LCGERYSAQFFSLILLKVRVAIRLCKASALFEEYKFCACVQEKNEENEKKFGAENCTRGRVPGDRRGMWRQSGAHGGIAQRKSTGEAGA
jgi:hypothetical protein